MKKTLCILLSLLMLFSFAACGGKEDTPEETTDAEQTGDSTETTKLISDARAAFILPYCDTDSLNPYKVKTQINQKIGSLIYDSLYTLDSSFMPVPVIAGSADMTDGGVTVTLKGDIRFSDSSELNASDVVYSFQQAKENDRYKELLGNIKEAVAIQRFTVKFTLEREDKFALNILTFPVIKYGSADSDIPTGSGRYTFSKDSLKYNKTHVSGKKPKIKTVGLCPLNERTNFVDSLQIGNISFIFKDLADCDIQRAVARTVPVTLNNLVYLGINGNNELLKDKTLRRIINTAIDKDAVVSQDYHGYAVRTETPFNPQWGETKEKESVFDQAKAAEMLEKNGFNYAGDTDKYRRNKDGRQLKFTILVCSDNEFREEAAQSIAKNLNQVGIGAEVVSVSFGKYKERVKDGKFDLYLGEVKLCENMSLMPFFADNGKTRYGINRKNAIVSAYDDVLSGKKSVSDFETEFSKVLPFIPVCYRQGVVMTSNTLSDNIKSVPTDVFANISEWRMN